MNAKKTLGRAALSCEVEDGLLDIDQILNTEPWTQIDDFVQHNFLQNILNEFNEQITLDPDRAPKEETKKPRTVKSKRTPRKKKEASDENRVSNSKAPGGEKLKDKIEKSSIGKKKNEKKSNGDSGKIKKKKGMARDSKKDAGKSAEDRKTQGNSPEANPSSTVTMSGDGDGTPIVDEMAETMEGTHEMETWQDIVGLSYETTVPRGESSRIDETTVPRGESSRMDEVTLPRNLIGSTETTVADCPNVSQVRSETITNEEGGERRERKSLRRSRSECPDGEKHLLENTAEKEASPDHELDESKRRKRQPAGKSSCLQGKAVVEKNVSKSPGGKGGGRKSLRKSSDEKDSAEKTVEKNISTGHEETDVEKKTGRKSLRRSKCLEEQNPAEKEISDDEGSSGQTKAKRRSLETSKSSKGKESAEKIAKKNIPSSHEKTDVDKTTGRKSLKKSKCLEEENPADKQISDDAECSGQTRAKKRSLEASKSSKDSAEKIVDKNISISHEETDARTKRTSRSVGTSTCLDEENPARKQISDDAECSGQTSSKRMSSETSKSSKESAGMIAKKNIPNKEPDGEKKEKSTEQEKDPAKKQVSKDRKKTEADSKCSKGDKCVAKKKKNKKTREKKPRKKLTDKFVAIKDKKVGKYERLLLEKRKRRETRRLRRHERRANLAIAKFGHCVTKIAKKMGYLEESQLESSDSSISSDSSDSSSSSSSSYTSDSDDSSSISFTTCHSTSSSMVSCSSTSSSDHCCSQSFSSCSSCSKTCSDPNCERSSPCSCIDYTDTSEYSELTSSTD